MKSGFLKYKVKPPNNPIMIAPKSGMYGIFFSTKYIMATAIRVAIISGGMAAAKSLPLLRYTIKKINNGAKSVINFNKDLFTIMF